MITKIKAECVDTRQSLWSGYKEISIQTDNICFIWEDITGTHIKFRCGTILRTKDKIFEERCFAF